MADVKVTYGNLDIIEMNSSGTKTLKTEGKYCTGDITVTYDKPIQGAIKVKSRANNTITITEGSEVIATYTLSSTEYYHLFENIDYGTYTVTASQTSYTSRSISVTHAGYLTSCSVTASPLPDDYTELTYIQSALTNVNNGSYIDTGVLPATNLTWEVEFEVTNQTGWAGVIGSRLQNGGYRYWHIYQSTALEVGCNGDVNSTRPIVLNTKTRRKQVMTQPSANSISYACYYWDYNIEDYYLDTAGTTAWITTLGTITLFGIKYTTEGYIAMPAHGLKIYKANIWETVDDKDRWLREFIPCRSPDNEIGMFDAVHQQFYGSSGSLVFLPGDPV